jgi:hypothetical protein
MAATDSLDATLQYPQHRAWWEQWQTAETYLRRLREAYQPDAIGGDPRRLANECLKACWEVRDWLKNDDHITPRVTAQQLDAHVNNCAGLPICRAFANTSKHLLRDSPSQLHARIDRVSTGSQGLKVMVDHWSTRSSLRSMDALRLAEQSMNEWQQFPNAYGLRPPT